MRKTTYGASLSTIVCDDLGLDELDLMRRAVSELGLKRFRLMSYWSECQPTNRKYDFSRLLAQLELAEELGVEVTMCLGVRQPRWPECHIPEWLRDKPQAEQRELLFKFVEKTVRKVEGFSCITSYQLENEALNRGFGVCNDFSRDRLTAEYSLVRTADPSRPIVMTTSNSWGLPVRAPRPDIVGFSMYRHMWGKGRARKWHFPPIFHRARRLAAIAYSKDAFCHELQVEPWGPQATQTVSDELQMELMGPSQISAAFNYAHKAGMRTVDLWGLEWWYWRNDVRKDPKALKHVRKELKLRSK